MRIRELHIDGFGRFSGVEYGPLEGSVTVFYGPNEAGKSTLLEFVRRVLFGFPRRSGRVNAYPAMAGGRYGGRIAIEDSDGRLYDVRRTTGRSYSGEITLTSRSGDPLPEAELTTLLGNHSRDVFEQVFAFTLDELYSDDLLNDANVNSQIYSAGMGVTSLQEVTNTLDRSRNSLFRSGGSTQEIYSAANSLDTVDSTLRDVEDNATMYGQLTSRLQKVESELEELAAQRRRIQSRHNRQVTLQNAWDAWNDSVSAKNRLNELTEIEEFPRNGVSKLDKLENLNVTAREELEVAERRVKGVQDRAELTIEHELILNRSSAVRDLERRRSAFDQSVKDIPERQAELAAMRVDLENTLVNLGKDWDVERLTGFDLSIVVREEIANYGSRLSSEREAVGRTEAAFEADETALKEAVQDLEHAQYEFDSASSPQLDRDDVLEKRRRIRAARKTLDELSRSEERADDLRSQLDDEPDTATASRDWRKPIPSAIGGMALILLGILFGTVGDWALPVGLGSVALGISLMIVATYLFASSGPSKRSVESSMAARIRRQIGEAEERSTELRSRLSENAWTLGIDSVDTDSLDDAEESLNVEEARINERDRLETMLDEIKNRKERRTARRNDSRQAFEEAKRTMQSIEDEWRSWLVDRSLVETFSPENIEALRSLVDLGRTHHAKVSQMEDRIAAIFTDIKQFIEVAQPLASAHGFEVDWNDYARVAVTADQIIDLHTSVVEESRKRRTAKDDLASANDELARRRNDLAETNDAITALLHAGGAQHSEEFLRKATIYDECQELKAKALSAHNRLQRLSGPGEALERLRADLTDTDPQSIDDAIAALEDERDNTDAQISERDTERGAMQREVKALVGEEESSRLRMERHVLQEQIKSHAREWARLTLAQNLLEEARRKFERERQPGVVRHAEKFFTQITDGRYRQVYAPLGEQTITVTDADGQTKQPSELSRGTREQLFLSLRFGLIRELGQRTEPLPVVVDEVLVNFDPERALRAAVAFTELSSTNQVLVFTCHPTVVELFRDAASEAGIEEPAIVQIN